MTVGPEAPGQVPPPSGKELMYVQVELFNVGTETLQITPTQFSLTDAAGVAVKTFGKRQAYSAGHEPARTRLRNLHRVHLRGRPRVHGLRLHVLA